MRPFRFATALALAAAVLVLAPTVRGGPFTDVAGVVPGDAQIYVELRDLAGLRDDWRGGDLWARFKGTEVYQELVSSIGYQNFQAGMDHLETQYDFDREQAVEDIFGGTVAFAVRLRDGEEKPATLAVVKGSSGDALRKYLDIITTIQEGEGKLKDSSESTYEGHTIQTKVTVEQNKQGELHDKVEHLTFAGRMLLVSNDLGYLKEAIDLADKPGAAGIASNEKLVRAAGELPVGAKALIAVDVAPLAELFLSQPDLAENIQNPLAANILFTLRGYLESLSTSVLGVYAGDTVKLVAHTTYSPEKVAPNLRRLLSPSGQDLSALALLPARTVASVHMNFDPEALVGYLRDVLPPEQRQQLESVLTMVNGFTGANGSGGPAAGPEAIGGQVSIAVVRNRDGEGIPNGALIVGLRDVEETRPRLEGAIGATLSLVAMDQNKKGNALALSTEKAGGVTIHSFGPLEQFTPAYAFIGSNLVVSNSRLIVREMAEIAAGNGASSGPGAALGELVSAGGNPKKAYYVDMRRVADLMDDFKEKLITDEVAKKGKPREQVEKEMRNVIEVIRLGGTLRAVTSAREGRITTILELTGASSE